MVNVNRRKSVSSNKNLLVDLTRYGDRIHYLNDILYYASDRTVEQYKKIRMHPMCWLGLNFLKLGLADVPFVLECDDENKRLIVEKALKKIWRRMMRDAFEKLEFGFKPMEIRWEVGTMKYSDEKEKQQLFNGHFLKQPRSLDPETVEILVEPGIGSFVGFRQDNDVKRTCLATERKALLFTHNLESGNFYGISALEPAFPYWYDANLNRQFHMRWLERKGTGFFKGYYPEGETEVDGTIQQNQQIMMDLLDTIMEGNAISIPSDTNENGNRLWDIEFMSDQDKTDPFLNRANYIDEMILKALIIPEKALTQGEIGARSSIEAFQDMFIQRKQDILDDTVNTIDKYLLPNLVEVNFGKDVEMSIKAGRLDDNSKDAAGKIVEKLLEKDKIKVNYVWLGEKTGVPLEEQESPEPVVPDFVQQNIDGENDERNNEKINRSKNNFPGDGKEEKGNTKEKDKNKKDEEIKKMAADYVGRWRAFDRLEQKYNLAQMDSTLDRLKSDFIQKMTDELNKQFERVKRYLDKAYNADGKAAKVAGDIIISQAPIKKIFRDYMKNIYSHAYTTAQAGVEGLVTFAATDPANQYITFRVDVTGDKFAKEFENELKYKINDDLSSQTSKPEMYDNLNIILQRFISGRLRNNAETELGFVLGKGIEDYIKWNNMAVKKGLLSANKEVARVKYSAIMDKDVCDYCAAIDGIVTTINSGVYRKYDTPAHYHCRCVWLPITTEEIDNINIPGTNLTLNENGRPLTINDISQGRPFNVDGETRKVGKKADLRTF